jgi:WD40 repeat protein
MNALRKKLLVVTAVTFVSMAVQPGILSAQTSGLGTDGFTRVLWKATDGSISLWKFDASLNSVGSPKNYGPFGGFVPVAMTTAPSNETYVLWKSTDGSISIWRLNADLDFLTSRAYGPFTGWIAQGLSTGPGNRLRLIWRYTTGILSIWDLDAGMTLANARMYGPFFGYDPGAH